MKSKWKWFRGFLFLWGNVNIRCHRSSSWPLRVNGSCLHLKITAHQMVRASPRQPSCGGEAAVGSGAPTQLDRNGIVSSNKKLSDSSTSRNKHWVTAGGGRGGTFDQVSREESSRLGSTQGWALLSDSPPPLHRAAPSLPNTEGFCSHSHLEPLHSSLLLPCSRPWCPNVPHSQTRRSLDALNAFQFSLVHVRGLWINIFSSVCLPSFGIVALIVVTAWMGLKINLILQFEGCEFYCGIVGFFRISSD